MTHQDPTVRHRQLLAQHAEILKGTAVVPPLKTKHTQHFAITKVSHGDGLIDLLVSLKGRSPSSATVVFENLEKPHARDILKILTESCALPPRAGDPVRSISLMIEALSYAEAHQLSSHTRTGHVTHNELSNFFDAEIKTFSRQDLARMVDIEGLGDGIYHLSFPNQFMMNATFLRPQEYFESPKFRRKVFTIEEFTSWYSRSRPHGQFSYYSDWSGFNLPDEALKPFIRGVFDPISPLESILTDTFRNMRGPLYLIGTLKGDARGTLRHEIAHALYHTNPNYKSEVDETLSSVNLTPIYRMLKGMGYHRLRWRDEAHAYLGDLPSDLEGHGINSLHYRVARQKLLTVYNRFSPIKHR